MAPKCTTSSGQPLKDNAPLRIVGNVNVPPRKTEEEPVPLPMAEGMTQVMGNWERLIEHQIMLQKFKLRLLRFKPELLGSNHNVNHLFLVGTLSSNFEKLGPPFFKGELGPIVVESLILNLEKYFDVLDCFET